MGAIKFTLGVQIQIPAPIPGIRCMQYLNRITWISVSENLISSISQEQIDFFKASSLHHDS